MQGSMGGPESILLINMDIVSRVKPHERINSKQATLAVEGGTWWYPTSLVRYWRQDDRGTLMARVQGLVEEAKRYLRNAQISSDATRERRFLNKLATMIAGLTNLKQTYQEDTRTVAHLELIIEYIKEVLRSYDYKPPVTVVMDDFHGADDTDSEEEKDDLD
jgi:hypothetical protein